MRLVESVQRAPDTETALGLIQDEIEPELQELLDREDAEALNRSILKHIAQAQITKTHLTKDDLYGALACFWLVFLSCLPAALPFLIFSRPLFALRVSNFLLIAILFFVGQKWAQYAGTNRLVAGSVLVAIGLALVGVAILLGG
jgi:VIT1/CCC1 family predicted Fe2+/Mn2+ transporter